MALPHSGNGSELLEIETKDFILKFHGEAVSQKAKNLNININIPAKIFIRSLYDDEVKLKTLTDFGNLVVNSGYTMMPCFYEDGRYQIVLQMKETSKYEIYNGGINISNKFATIVNILLGTINFSSDIGYTIIDIIKENTRVLSLTIEVFPSKLDYMKDYREMINEINEEISSLAFKFFDITYLQTKLKDTHYQTNVEFLSILDYIFDDFITILEKIEMRFRFNIVNYEQIMDTNRTKRVSNRTKSYLRSHPNLLMKSDNGFINIEGI